MMDVSKSPWLQGTHSGMVSIDNHDIYLHTTGPDRVSGQPVVILESGLGGSSSSWPLVIRHLSPFIRIYVYDRAGLGKSEINPLANRRRPEEYAERSAEDLDKLLRKVGIEGPFILVPMSWGGIVAREFLERRTQDVVGMVMIECCQERTSLIRPINDPRGVMTMLYGLDFFEVVGVKQRQRLTDSEWKVQMQDLAENSPQTAIETFAWPLTERTLGGKKQFERVILGGNPISVIKGNSAREYQDVYDAGIAAGNGTEEARASLLKVIDGMEDKDDLLQREQIKLSTRSRFTHLEKPGHLVILEDPETIAKEVRWILELYKK